MTAYKNLVTDRESPTNGPTKNDVFATDGFNVALVGPDAGQEIEPHPESYAVFFFVLEDAGEFTTGEGGHRVDGRRRPLARRRRAERVPVYGPAHDPQSADAVTPSR